MLKMGCSKADITPGFPVFLRGYASRNKLTCEIEDSIEAGIIALEQNGKRSLIITVDNAGFGVLDCRKIYSEIAAAVSISYPDIIIACSHTHFAPGFSGFNIYFSNGELQPGSYPADDRYYAFFMEKLLPAVKHAIADLEEVELLQADIPVSSIAFNRRTVRKSDGMVTTNYTYPVNPENYDFTPMDITMHTWKFMRGGVPKGVLASYGCHPVTGGYNFYGISADYPGYFKKYILEKMHCPGFFMLGTAGDTVPILRAGEARKDIGQVMASSVRLAERTFRKTTCFELKTASIPLEVVSRYKNKTGAEMAKMWQDELDRAQQTKEYSENMYVAGMAYETYSCFNSHHAMLDIQFMRLGDRTLVALPFEPLTDTAELIKKAFPDTVIISCTGGYEGYLPTTEDYHKGGYETYTGTVWDEKTCDDLISTTLDALKSF